MFRRVFKFIIPFLINSFLNTFQCKGTTKPKKPLTDEELVELFGEMEKQSKSKKTENKKSKKKKNKKKPTTDNSVRKTKKPVKL